MAAPVHIPTPDSNAATSTVYHPSPPLGLVAIIFTVLFGAGLSFVILFGAGHSNFPGPWESADTIVTYFQTHSWPVLMCAFFQFGAAVALGEFAISTMSRLFFWGECEWRLHRPLRRSEAPINFAASACVLWVMASPAVAQNSVVLPALYYFHITIGGVGFAVPMALFMAGVCIPAAFMKLLPKWIVIFGLILAGTGALSWFSMIFPKTCFLIPLTIFPSVIWMIATGFALPRTAERST